MRKLWEENRIHKSWIPFIDEKRDFLENLSKKIDIETFCPERHRVLRFTETDLYSAKVVILGQDPYPQKGAATGRAFEVGGLKSWDEAFRQVSLKNILRLIYAAYTGEPIKWTDLREKIRKDLFPVLPPDRLFLSWEEQGVLLLNSSLTCRENEPMSHAAFWRPFERDLYRYISEIRPDLYWFLWGKSAVSAAGDVPGKRYISRHPMLCGGKSTDDFLKNPCFMETKDMINWTGI